MERVSTEKTWSMPRRLMFETWCSTRSKDTKSKVDAIIGLIINFFNIEAVNDSAKNILHKKITSFCKRVQEKWTRCNRTIDRFLKENKDWLNETINLYELRDSINCVPLLAPRKGRPAKSISDSSRKTKKRRVHELLKYPLTELLEAVRIKLYSAGYRDAAFLVKQINDYPQKANYIKKSCESKVKLPIKVSMEDALAVFVDAKLSRSQYLEIKKQTKVHNADIYPGYDKLLEEKKRSYPTDILISENSAEVRLQSLLDHTVNRIVVAHYTHIQQLIPFDTNNNCTCSIIYKWGCDGASDQSNYKQKYENIAADDSYLFTISLVPIELKCDDVTLWKNNTPSSTRYCRPIKICFEKETSELIKHEIQHVKDQIGKLTASVVSINGCSIFVNHVMVLTMIDGKICNTLADVSSQKCYICNATPKDMNDLQNHENSQSVDRSMLSFGFSSLHAWIRFFECILHIGYRLEVKTWQVRKVDKERVDIRKKIIQSKFRNEMGLIADVPKHGYGNSNDGNTARKFFDNPSLSSHITGVDENLIRRFSIILQTISCGLEIDDRKFTEYALQTASLYVQKYPWYYMPPTVHKVLIHGGEIIKTAILPIGKLSEEAQEARNKECRLFRSDHSRKFSRTENIEDVFHMLLLTSDPLISSKRRITKKCFKELAADAKGLLKSP